MSSSSHFYFYENINCYKYYVDINWAYLKEKKLQDPEDKLCFTPDETMVPVFGLVMNELEI